MRLAYVHVLPLEYYPPATNSLAEFAAQREWTVRAWTSRNTRGLKEWNDSRVAVRRPNHAYGSSGVISRMAGHSLWHAQTAVELARWKPDAIISVEPHSTLGVYAYYATMRGSARLFIHHHEYYAPEDFLRPGMRFLRAARTLERDSLLERAAWVSQTNETRLALMLETHPRMRPETARVLPNYPPQKWIERGRADNGIDVAGRTRLVYVGSASFEDTFIREIALWVRDHPQDVSLHVVGDNIAPDVWTWLSSLAATNITIEPKGIAYAELPHLLVQFDVGLVIYKAHTLNFVHNVPNKAFEYLACGLEVWYPPEMTAMESFAALRSDQRTREIDFKHLAQLSPPHVRREPVANFPFTCETALGPLVSAIDLGNT